MSNSLITDLSSSIAFQNVSQMDLIDRSYLDSSWSGADYYWSFVNSNYPHDLNYFFNQFGLSSSPYDVMSLSGDFDAKYLSHVESFKKTFVCKDFSSFLCFHKQTYDSIKHLYHDFYSFDFFNIFDFSETKNINFLGFNPNNSGSSGLSDDSLINYFNGQLLEHVFVSVTMYSKRLDGFMMPCYISLFKYFDRWIFVIPLRYTQNFNTWNYMIDASVLEVKKNICCLAECFGIVE